MQTQKKTPNIRTYQNKFNIAFEKARAESEYAVPQEEEPNYKKYKGKNMRDNDFEPRKYTDDLGINMKNLFFEILEMLSNGMNPLPYIMDDSNRQFTFAVLTIMVGVLFMFFSNLMI